MTPEASARRRKVLGVLAGIWVAAAGAGMLLARPHSAEIADMLAYSLIVPILFASFAFGRRGGLGAALAASLACGALVVTRSGQLSPVEVRQLLYQVGVFNVVALVTSWLSDRLLEARNRYRDLFDGSPGGMYRLAPDGRILEVNRAIVDMLRAGSRRELLERNARELFVHSEDLRRWMEAVRGGGGVDVETQVRRLDGTVIWVRDRNQAVRDENGKVRWFEGFVEDITERRHSEAVSAALYDIANTVARTRELPQLYRNIHGILRRYVDADDFFIAVIDRDEDRLDFVYFEDQHEREVFDIRNLDDPKVFSLTLEVIKTGRFLFLDREQMDALARERGLPPIGARAQVWLGVPLKVKDTVIGCMTVQHYTDPGHFTKRDVDFMVAVSEQVAVAIERGIAEEALERANALHLDIIDFLPDATAVVNENRRVIAWNKAMEEMTSIPKADMLGRDSRACGEAFYGTPRPVLLDMFWDEGEVRVEEYDFVERVDKMLVAETWVPIPGSRGRHVWAVAAPLYDAQGLMVGAIESVRDVTKRKQAEGELRRAHDEMERRVDERTRELQQANLRLRELDEMKTEFLSSASHELRTPLTSVLGFVKLIRKSFERHFLPLAREDDRLAKQGGRIRDNLDIIAYEGRRLTRLINDLLDLNKIESGRMDWRDEPLDVGALVRLAVAAVQGEYEGLPGVNLSMDVAEGLPKVMADRDRVQQVVLNLLSNAAKFTMAGSVYVSARGEGDRVRVEVRDTGPGIPPEDIDLIFGKFYQSAVHLGRDGIRGTGLGLTICREIVEHYGGRIIVESSLGSGSVFTMELPAQAS